MAPNGVELAGYRILEFAFVNLIEHAEQPDKAPVQPFAVTHEYWVYLASARGAICDGAIHLGHQCAVFSDNGGGVQCTCSAGISAFTASR